MKKEKKPLPLSVQRFLPAVNYTIAGIIAVLPFHAFLTVWAADNIGQYTLLRLWKEFLLVALVIVSVAVSGVMAYKRGYSVLPLLRRPIPLLVVAYLVLLLGSGLAALATGDVTVVAFAYGLLLNARFIVLFGVVWAVARQSSWIHDHWHTLLLVPAGIVIAFGILQATFLPPDFLSHFGYGPSTIDAVQTIDEKASYQRVQSTLRGANPLGAYLIIVIAACWALVFRSGQGRPRLAYAGMLTAAVVTLGLTYSRSAWIGVAAALGLIIWMSVASVRTRKLLLVGGSVGVLILAAIGFSLRDNDIFQNAVLHTDENSRSSMSSNQGHLEATRQAAQDILEQPQGSGTGTAGPASVYGSQPARIAENYYLQIGQEVGVVGMGIFAAINILVGRELWLRRRYTLAVVLLASLVGISAVNLLSHAWTDDTLSYIWWGLAGAALALPIRHVAGTGDSRGSIIKHKHER